LKNLYSINIKDAQAKEVIQESQDIAKAETDHKAKRDCQREECDQRETTTTRTKTKRSQGYGDPTATLQFFGKQLDDGQRKPIRPASDGVCCKPSAVAYATDRRGGQTTWQADTTKTTP